MSKIIFFAKNTNPFTLDNLKQWSINIVFHSPDFQNKHMRNLTQKNSFKDKAILTTLNGTVL